LDAVKHLVLCHIERRPPRLDMTVYPYMPQAHVAMTLAKTYLGLLTGAVSVVSDREVVIPSPIDQNPCAHWRNPSDIMRQGWSTSLFQASQQWSTRSS
jgi:hypothetical protein